MAICWEILSRQIFTVLILNAALVVLVPLPFGVWGGMWNSIVSAPDHCLFVYFLQSIQAHDHLMAHGFPPLIRDVRGMSPEKDLGSERRFCCNFGL